ncbi:hypothetical protein TcWFU_001180 [Taenia crassiceps]|uniref:Uncharacterized protein n=1 Tax=Taenia crassiceps TaxID=6207 RepID=A0ABR4PZP4_9CEST
MQCRDDGGRQKDGLEVKMEVVEVVKVEAEESEKALLLKFPVTDYCTAYFNDPLPRWREKNTPLGASTTSKPNSSPSSAHCSLPRAAGTPLRQTSTPIFQDHKPLIIFRTV